MAEQSVRLDQLPTEVLEKFVVGLSRFDIRSLLLVNKRFKEVFENSIVWRNCSYYPEKYYWCDRNSCSTDIRVINVLKHIPQSSVICWRSYCKLQSVHLDNWVSGRNSRYDIIPLSPAEISYMEEMVDDNHRHLVFFSVGQTLHIWDVTAEPPTRYEPVQVGAHKSVRLVPCGKVLVHNLNSCVITVYGFSSPLSLRLLYSFQFDSRLVQNPQNNNNNNNAETSRASRIFRYIVAGNMFVGYNHEFLSLQECSLHLWDLNGDVPNPKPEVNLSEFDIMRAFVHFLNTQENVDITRRSNGCELRLYAGELPNVVVVLSYIHIKLSQINIFNTNTSQFTHLVQTRSEILSCSTFYNNIFVEEKIFTGAGNFSHISVYAINSRPAGEGNGILIHERLVFEWSARTYRDHHPAEAVLTRNVLYNVVLKKSKVFIKTQSEVIFLIFDPEFHQGQFTIANSYKILGFIEPKILLMYDSRRGCTATDVKVYNILSGTLVCSWQNVNIESHRFMHYFRNLEYPSKLILNIDSERQFRVYKF